MGVVSVGLLIGCGQSDLPEIGEVTGTITKGGEVVPDAWIEFEPETGRLSAARTDANGVYSLDYTREIKGAIIGKHTVKIGTGGGERQDHSAQSRGSRDNVRRQLFEKSAVEVTEGENTLDFEITEGNEYSPRSGPAGAHGGR